MNKIRFSFALICIVCALTLSALTHAQEIKVSVEIPQIKANPYHKPYVAIWVETKRRKGVHTLAFWKEQPDWFKDLRQWWRKIGRDKTPNYDAVTGATRKPGTYQLTWDGQLNSGENVPAGQYVLHIEAVREQGSREYIRQIITLGDNQTQTYQLQGKTELGSVQISIK
ncbi:DUF2271 domain-containing protein [Thalassotalea sp. M1531]|uniref:DUF2271 domain-containing protein n=1 Tax=Thalassotalea algicola TaxID=2716224 RepID=A0A7Y0LA07_9GAMM|nr:DUF2271 domain-containing protein [Thalassotalea algicola]NMP30714.1 DUF2271 domain-containing protein [Thalassotalea algicola]